MRILLLTAAATFALTACGGGGDTAVDPVDEVLALSGDATAGETVYNGNCSGCHDSSSYPDLATTSVSDQGIADIVLYGVGSMPSFEGDLTSQQVADVIAYINSIAA